MKDRTNPYLSRSVDPKLRRSALAFLDILGYENIVLKAEARGEGQMLLRRLRAAIEPPHRALHGASRDFGHYLYPIFDLLQFPRVLYRAWFAPSNFHVAAFTDNIVIGLPIKGDDELTELQWLINLAADYQYSLTQRGFFVRGGISVGDAYLDAFCVFGPALIEAYQVEKSIARYPRLVLAKSAASLFRTSFENFPDSVSSNESRVEIDEDGELFVNYLPPAPEDLHQIMGEFEEADLDPYRRELRAHKELIIRQLQENRLDPHIAEKYRWCVRMHNRVCYRHSEWLGEPYVISEANV